MGGDSYHSARYVIACASPLRQRPAFAILSAKQVVRVRCVGDADALRVPVDLLARTERDVPKMVRFRKPTAVSEMASRGSARFARANPLLVVADRVGNRFWRTFK